MQKVHNWLPNLVGKLTVAVIAIGFMAFMLIQFSGGSMAFLLSTEKTGFIGFTDHRPGSVAEFSGTRMKTVHGDDHRLTVGLPVVCNATQAKMTHIQVVADASVAPAAPMLSVNLPWYESFWSRSTYVMPSSVVLHVAPTEVNAWKIRLHKANEKVCMPARGKTKPPVWT